MPANLPHLRAACQAATQDYESSPVVHTPLAATLYLCATALPAALEVAEYAEHRLGCPLRLDQLGRQCTCGLRAALAALEAAGGGDG